MSFQVFFIIPCLDIYQKIDMRTATYDVPPQEVSEDLDSHQNFQCFPRSDPDEGQCDSFCECHNVLQGELEKLANPPIINLTTTKKFNHFLVQRWQTPSEPWPTWTTIAALPGCLLQPPSGDDGVDGDGEDGDDGNAGGDHADGQAACYFN